MGLAHGPLCRGKVVVEPADGDCAVDALLRRVANSSVNQQDFLICLAASCVSKPSVKSPSFGSSQALTHELSGTFVICGEYWDTGKPGTLPLCTGEPSPAIPETLFRFEPEPFVVPGGGGRTRPVEDVDIRSFSLTCWSRAMSDCSLMEGGVSEPLVGVVPGLASLAVSVDRSVLKLARDLLRKSLKLRKDGAMAPVVTGASIHAVLVAVWCSAAAK